MRGGRPTRWGMDHCYFRMLAEVSTQSSVKIYSRFWEFWKASSTETFAVSEGLEKRN